MVTSISPDRNTAYDYDLSTLSNIRLNNRRARQKLSNNVLNQSTASAINISPVYNRSYVSRKAHPDENQSLFRDSPIPRVPSSKKYSPLKSNSYDIDSSLLEKDNLKYLDKDYYSNGSKINELKREKFLNTINSANNTNHNKTNSNDFFNYDDKPLRETINYKDLGFRPRNKDIKIPNLKPDDYYLNYGVYHNKSPIKTRHYALESNNYKKAESSHNNKKSDELEDLDFLDHESKEQLKNYDQRFQQLINKYQLDELSKPIEKEFERGSSGARELENKLEQKKNLVRQLYFEKKNESNKNEDLSNKIVELDKFIEFLETNFDQLYNRFNILKLEKHELHKTNQELVFINNYYKSLLKKEKTINPITPGRSVAFDDDSTTFHLLNFKTKKTSQTFHKLDSIKKFKAIGFAVLATVRLQKRVQHHQAYTKKIQILMDLLK